jgi:hypothetical protein
MDGRRQYLTEKLERLLRETAEVASELERHQREDGQPVHYMQIELAAHEVSRRLSCRIQERSVGEVAAGAPLQAACPGCGERCCVETEKRTIHSIDGPVEVIEPQAHCDRCRRSFFPSA